MWQRIHYLWFSGEWYTKLEPSNNYKEIVKDIREVLNENGVLIFEIGYDQRDALINICEEYLVGCSVDCYKDISGNDRIVVIRL